MLNKESIVDMLHLKSTPGLQLFIRKLTDDMTTTLDKLGVKYSEKADEVKMPESDLILLTKDVPKDEDGISWYEVTLDNIEANITEPYNIFGEPDVKEE